MHKATDRIRFIVAPDAFMNLAVTSKAYKHFQLVNYPVGTRYPLSSSELQTWVHWKDGPQLSDIVSNIRRTLVYKLLRAFLVGTTLPGASAPKLLKFVEHAYGWYHVYGIIVLV